MLTEDEVLLFFIIIEISLDYVVGEIRASINRIIAL